VRPHKGEGPSKYEFEGPSSGILPVAGWAGCRGWISGAGAGSTEVVPAFRGCGPRAPPKWRRRSAVRVAVPPRWLRVPQCGVGVPRRSGCGVSHGWCRLLARRTGPGSCSGRSPTTRQAETWPLRRWRPVCSGGPVHPGRCDLVNGLGVPPWRRPRTLDPKALRPRPGEPFGGGPPLSGQPGPGLAGRSGFPLPDPPSGARERFL